MQFDAVEPGVYPEQIYPPYVSTRTRGPTQAPIRLHVAAPAETAIPFSPSLLGPKDSDLTAHGSAMPLGERIVVTGIIRDEDGSPIRDSLVEVWQCNAAGRYWHRKDQHDAPLDPNFFGFGKMFTDNEGRYRFRTIKPAPYPWGNHVKAWRPAHIHFSLFGNVYAQRLVTQMYFPGEPLLSLDPIYQSIPDLAARERLIARFNMDETVGGEMLGYQFDLVLRGRGATPFGI